MPVLIGTTVKALTEQLGRLADISVNVGRILGCVPYLHVCIRRGVSNERGGLPKFQKRYKRGKGSFFIRGGGSDKRKTLQFELLVLKGRENWFKYYKRGLTKSQKLYKVAVIFL